LKLVVQDIETPEKKSKQKNHEQYDGRIGQAPTNGGSRVGLYRSLTEASRCPPSRHGGQFDPKHDVCAANLMDCLSICI
jgi:hypothetical protein